MSRISPLDKPYSPEVDAVLRKVSAKGHEPITLFRTLARNLPMFEAMTAWGSYELGPGLSVSLRDREIVIDRTCALRGSEYEWGVHVAVFAGKAALTAEQVRSLTHGSSTDDCWSDERDRLLMDLVDSLHANSDLDDQLWSRLLGHFSEEQLMDLVLLCGWYHAISFVARVSRLEPEPGTPRF